MSEGYQNVDIDRSTHRADPHAMLLAELADFVTHHRPAASSLGTPLSRARTATCSASPAAAASRSYGG